MFFGSTQLSSFIVVNFLAIASQFFFSPLLLLFFDEFFSEWIFFVGYLELDTEAGCESEHSLLLFVLLFTLTGLEPPELVRGRPLC